VTDGWHINGYHVQLIRDAVEDIKNLYKKDPQIVRLVTKKIIQIAKEPYAGKSLHGDLLNFRKITVGNNHWRIVWRVYESEKRIEYSVVWGVGPRSNEEIYKTVKKRIIELGEDPETIHLKKALEVMNPRTLKDRMENSQEESIEAIHHKLIQVAGIPADFASKLELKLAKELWRAFLKQ
jgi:mRNA interferase RelE/StbE